MDWTLFQEKFPAVATNDHGELRWTDDMLGAQPVRVFPSPYQKYVMTIDMGDYPGMLPFSLGDLITEFGSPCLLEMRGFEGSARLVYPTMYAILDISAAHDNPNYRLPMDLPVSGLILTSQAEKYRSCRTMSPPYADAWYGFTSAEIYRQRNLAAIDKTDPPDDGS